MLQCAAVCCSHMRFDAVTCQYAIVDYALFNMTSSMSCSHTAHCEHCNTLQHTATHCNTLQHTATHCNTLQHTATHVVHVVLSYVTWCMESCGVGVSVLQSVAVCCSVLQCVCQCNRSAIVDDVALHVTSSMLWCDIQRLTYRLQQTATHT